MNKDEMIKDMSKIVREYVANKTEDEDTHYVYIVGKCHDKILFATHNAGVSKALYNAGYRKVADDEIVVKRSELERLKNLEINYEQVYEDYRKLEQEQKGRRLVADNQIVFTAHELCKEFSKHRQETARAILTTIYNRLRYATFRQTVALKIVKDVANALGIELE